MSERVCLRCDWLGEADEDACPRCGATLYVVGGPRSAHEPLAATEETTDETPADLPAGHPVSAMPAAAGRRWLPIALVVLTAAGIAGGLALVGAFDAPQGVAGPDAAARPPATAAAPTSPDPQPPLVASCQAAGPEEVVGSPGVPSGGEATYSIGPTEPIASAVVADYRFQGSFATSAGGAPNLRELCEGAIAFEVESVFERPRTVLRFERGGGLALEPTPVGLARGAYAIELVFRFDEVDGFRKILDVSGGRSDDGLYVLDGELTFFPRRATGGAIEPEAYVHVVLTRGADRRVVGYVDGRRQITFLDDRANAVIASRDTLSFLADDRTTGGEQTSGAVARIRLYDRPLSAAEVAQLACDEGVSPACG